jgi:cytochrome c biogenesis protein CcmG/thiol:disulfide interchange protein DsbE
MSQSAPPAGRWGRYAPLVIAAGFFLVFYFALFGGDPGRLPSALEGKRLPSFSLAWQGKEAALTARDLVTGQPVLLNVFASWCGPCRDEHPLLMQLAAQGVPIFGLNMKDAPDAAQRFLGQLGNPYRAIGADRSGRVGIELGVYGVPETFVLDAQGRVLTRYAGPLTPDVLKTEILPYLASPSLGVSKP